MQEEDFENTIFTIHREKKRSHFIIEKKIGIDPDLTFEAMGIYYYACCKEEDGQECDIDEIKYADSIKLLEEKNYLKS